MEECCAICAEPLEWLAYGPCGHREVCSTCTSKLRFILDDKKCCICRQECPNVVITKALGDYTNAVGDFSTLPAPANEGRVGNYWFHLDTQAYFDDEQHYKMIKAMCRLSCSVCDNTCGAQEPRKELPKRDREFKHIDQLRKHLFHAHKLSMCTLCLEGRKVFICEQKLYTRSQLDRHLSRGDSEVDGSETGRGGFMGHPICDFCRKRFYGDNEIYIHMSRDHYTCHICQRRHPEHFEYYQNYSDLEAHFSQEHFLCENYDCMAKKFVVFASEAELKRHNAIEHAGNMSRSQRNAALQIPVSFQYWHPGSERESQRVARGRGRNMNSSLSSANSSEMLDMVASSSTSTVSTDPPRYLTAVSRRVLNSPLEESAFPPLPGASETDPPRYPTAVSRRALNSPLEESAFPPLLSSDTVASSSTSTVSTDPPRYLTAVSRRALNSLLEESAFPPLPGASESDPPRYLTAVSRRALNSPLEESAFPPLLSSDMVASSSTRTVSTDPPRYLTAVSRRALNSPLEESAFNSPLEESAFPPPPGASETDPPKYPTAVSRRALNSPLEESAFPTLPVASGNASHKSMNKGKRSVKSMAALIRGQNLGPCQTSNAPLLSIEEVRAANKELIESIQSGLGGNEQQFVAFKDVSSRFRNGDIGARKYYSHISKLGLSHLVPRLARLCPDQDKGRKLLEAHEAGIKKNSQLAVNQIINQTGGISIGLGSIDNHRKGKTVDVGSSKDVTSSSNADSGRSLGKPSEEVEVLSKDGYRTAKGKAKPRETPVLNGMSGTSGSSSEEPADHCQRPPPLSDSLNAYHDEKWTCNACSLLNKQDSLLCLVCGTERPNGRFMKEPNYGRKGKQKKKASKAQRGNLDDSLASIESNQSSSGSSVWGNGGGQRLVSIAQR